MSDNPYEAPRGASRSPNAETKPPSKFATASLYLALFGNMCFAIPALWGSPAGLVPFMQTLVFLGGTTNASALGLGLLVLEKRLPGKRRAIVGVALAALPLMILFSMCLIPAVQ